MRDILEAVIAWAERDIPTALAVVTDIAGSGPRPVGTAMAVGPDETMVGNVSAGCVESAVVAEAQAVLTDGAPRRVRYGISDEQALSVGLTCGGEIEVFIFAVAAQNCGCLRRAAQDVAGAAPVALATVVEGPAPHGAMLVVEPDGVAGDLGSEGLNVAVTDDARGMLAQGETGVRRYGPEGGRRLDDVGVLVQALAPPPRMMVFGAIDFAASLAELGCFLGYHVTVCDARAAFATRERFPHVDELVVEWPHRYLERAAVDERTVVCVLTHDPKFDVPLLDAVLRTPAAYIGVMGSRRSQDDRRRRLREAGVSELDLGRLRAPIGLDLGARTPEETAVSIAAEMIALRWDGSGRPLRDIDGAIHRETP